MSKSFFHDRDGPAERPPAFSEIVRERLQPLLDLIEESDVEEISLEEGKVRVTIKRSAESVPAVAPALAPTAPAQPATPTEEAETHTVVAGRVGIFARGRGPNQRAVVEEGAEVQEGQLLGYIEVLNVLNEVQAPYAGTLERFLVESRQPVEYGQPLALIEPDPEPPVDDVE